MGVIKLRENLYSVGVLNPALRVFDIVMEAKYGTSYNAYLITGEKNVLVETVHATFFDEYLENIEQVIGFDRIDALIMNHTEPDHSGSLRRLLEKCPNLTVYCTAPAKKYLDAITNLTFRCEVVKTGDKLNLGGGRELEFLVAPLLHWPDSMFTWYPAEKTLFTCDFLGTHYCEPTMLDRHVHYPQKYEEQFAYYYRGIFGPFKPYVIKGLDLIDPLPAELVCPSHGPCLTDSFDRLKALYRTWSAPQKREQKQAVILYASAYGYTEAMAKAAEESLSGDPDLDVRCIDLVHTPPEEVAPLLESCDALLVGSTTINRDAPGVVWRTLSMVDAINTRKPAGAFGSYGWSGEAVPMLKSRLESLKFKFQGEGLRANFNPSEEDLNAMRDYARQIVSAI